ncbi:MAG: DegT/DnrJ/EryC1/StrS family aminotransferase [Acidobacteriota bacterium]|nr:MAG: DegT/DnrJ/EryC1/StrS family aminotransferase [Acidobacteriota bacterium]
MKRIPIAGPWITEREIEYVTDAVRNAWYENHSVYQQRFETAFARYVSRRYAISLPSCTSALHLSLLAAGVGPGDEVIVPDLTWIASAAPISYVGAKPVFADVDPVSWCLSAEALEAALTSRSKAVIPVDLYGSMPDMDAVLDLAHRRGLVVIEDAAESLGSEYRGRRAGSFGQSSTFSFHGSKTLTTGEGGMLVTDHEDVYQRCLFLRDHGRPPGDRYFFNTEVAWKYKMTSLQAALGLAQLERIDELIARKRQIFAWYREQLEGVPGLTLNAEGPDWKNSYWMVTVIVDASLGIDKRQLMDAMSQKGVDTRPFFHPLSSLPAYGQLASAADWPRRNPHAYSISPRGLNLPSGYNLDRAAVEQVCERLVDVLRGR